MPKANLIIIRDPFRRYDRETKTIECGPSLADIVGGFLAPANPPVETRSAVSLHPGDVGGVEFIVSVNGKIIPRDQLSVIFPGEGDSVVCVPEIGDGGGKSIFRALLMIGIAIAAPYAAAAMGFVTAAGALTTTGMFIAGGIALAGGLMLNVLLPPIKPKMPTMDGFDGSQSYSWNPHTLQTQGVVVPKWYGKNKLYGNIINSHIEYKGEKQYLYALIDLGIGPFKEIADIKIQDQNENKYSGVSPVAIRNGLMDQKVINNFQKTKIDYAISNTRLKYNKEKTYTTTGDSFNRLEVTIGFPNGLVKFDDDGDRKETSVNIKIRIKKQGDASWTVITRQAATTVETTVATAYWSLGRNVNIKNGGGADAWEEYQAGSSVRDDHTEGDEVDSGYETYQWRWFKKNKVYTKAATFDNYVTYPGTTTKSISKTWGKNIPDDKLGIHTIEVTRLTEDHDSSNDYSDNTYLTQVTEIIDNKYTYPRNVLMGIKALATDQLSGSLKFSCIARCSKVRVYTGTYPSGSWSVQYSNNLAWVVWDALTQPVFDNNLNVIRYDGMQPARIDLAKWKEWADYCADLVYDGKTIRYTTSGSTLMSIKLQSGGSDFDQDEDGEYPSLLIDPTGGTNYEIVAVTLVTDNTLTVSPNLSQAPGSGIAVKKAEKRVSFNGGVDTDTIVWDTVLKMCQVGRAVPVWNGVNLTLAIDKPASPVQMITVGNTEQDSFEETFLSMDERASEIEVDFVDRDKDYERNRVTCYNNNVTDKSNPVSMELFGITRESEAWRAGMFRLYKNQYIKRFAKVDIDIDAIAFVVGDVINVQCDVPQWGEGGRLVSATNSSVTLDKSVTIASGKSYNVMVRLSDDTVVEKSVTNTPGTYTTLTVSSFSQTPAQYDVYAFGEVTKVVKPFRVVNIERTQEQKCTLELAEYNESVYNADTDDPAVNTANYSSLDAVQSVQNLTLSEMSWIDHSGATRFAIQVDYTMPANGVIREVKIYYAEANTAKGDIKYTLSSSKDDIIYDVQPGKSYKVIIVSTNIFGIESSLKTSPSATITIGTVPAVTNTQLNAGIKGLQVFGQANDTEYAGRDCKLIWDQVQPVNLNKSAGSESNGAGSANPIPWFKDYKLEIWDTASTAKLPRRTEFISTNEYIYTFEKNYEDGLARNWEAWLWARDRFNRISETGVKLSVSNPAPKMLQSDGTTTITPTIRKIKGGHRISFTHPYTTGGKTEYDINYFLLECAENSGFATNLKKYRIASLVNGITSDDDTSTAKYKTETDGLDPEKTIYYRITPYDAYGAGTPSSTVSGKPGLTHDDDEADKARPTRYDYTKLTVTADTEINDDGKTVTNLIVKGEKASETDVDGYILEVRMVKDTGAADAPTGAEIDAGVTSGGKKCEGNTYQIGIDGEAGTGTTDTNYWKKKIPDIKNNWKAFFRARKQNTSGQKGAWSSESPGAWVTFVTTKANNAADTTAPAAPTVAITQEGQAIGITASIASPPADLQGFQFAVKSTAFSSDADRLSNKHADIDASAGKAKDTFSGVAGSSYYISARSYDFSKNFSAWVDYASNPVELDGLTLDSLSEPISMAIYTGSFTATDADTVTWASGSKVKIKRTGGNTKEYTITNGTTNNLAGTRYIVFNKDTSTTAFSVVTTPGDGDTVIAKVSPVTSGKANIVRFVGNEEGEYSIARYSGGFNQLSALIAYLGKVIIQNGDEGSLSFLDSSGKTAIRLKVNSGSDPDFVIMKSGEDAENGTDAQDPSKVAFSSKLTINGSPVRPRQPMIIESFNSQINSSTEFPAVTSGGGYNANSTDATSYLKYLTSVSGTDKRKISGDLSIVGGYTFPLPYIRPVRVDADGLVMEMIDIVHDPSNADTSKRIFLRRTLVNNSNAVYSWPARSDYVVVRLEAETFI